MAQQQEVAPVTGNALNIGRQIALHLALEDHRVMTTPSRSKADARETARLVREAGSDVGTHMANIADHAQAVALVDPTVRRFGRPDVLVNNASERSEILSATLDGAFYRGHSCCSTPRPRSRNVRGGPEH
jgi:NAD(P)-dependent dehydrogenase (short-subunit alcohol dehydrogenase family)